MRLHAGGHRLRLNGHGYDLCVQPAGGVTVGYMYWLGGVEWAWSKMTFDT